MVGTVATVAKSANLNNKSNVNALGSGSVCQKSKTLDENACISSESLVNELARRIVVVRDKNTWIPKDTFMSSIKDAAEKRILEVSNG